MEGNIIGLRKIISLIIRVSETNTNLPGYWDYPGRKLTIFNISAASQNFSTDYFQFNNIGAGSQQNPGGSGRARFAFNSYFGRINYTLSNKYLFTLTGRLDGSSKFGENNKYSFFPSAAIAWRASEEDFLKNSNVISNLKLRASYGITGNSEINTYASLSLLSSGYAAIINNQRVTGVGTNRLANPDLALGKNGTIRFWCGDWIR